MRSFADRYFNVFFAYRGIAVADVELSIGKQLEDNLTRALAVTLDHASVEARRSFLADVCALDEEGWSSAEMRLRLQAVEASEIATGRLVGISPRGDLARAEFTESPAGSRPDLLIEIPGEALVLIESKALGGTDGSQLWRHARAFGLDTPRQREGSLEVPASWVQRSWSDIARWAASVHDEDPVGGFLLGQLAEYLYLAGVTTRRVSVTAPAADTPIGIGEEATAFLELLAESVDLDALADTCRRLYGNPSSEFYVHGDDEDGHTHVTDDSAAVTRRYELAGKPVPPRLSLSGGNVITPRRALCIAYGPKARFMQSIATAQTRAGAAKLIDAGADRAVLIGLLAWAWPRSDVRAMRLRAVIATAWSQAPINGLAAGELHVELGPAVTAALTADPR